MKSIYSSLGASYRCIGKLLLLPFGVVVELISRKTVMLILLSVVYYILIAPMGFMHRCFFRKGLRTWRRRGVRQGWHDMNLSSMDKAVYKGTA